MIVLQKGKHEKKLSWWPDLGSRLGAHGSELGGRTDVAPRCRCHGWHKAQGTHRGSSEGKTPEKLEGQLQHSSLIHDDCQTRFSRDS